MELQAEVDLEAEQARLLAAIAEKEVERGRLREAVRRGILSLDDAEVEAPRVNAEEAALRAELQDMLSRRENAGAAEAYFAEVAALLARGREQLARAEGDPAARRALVERVVVSVTVTTTRVGRHKFAEAVTIFAWRPPVSHASRCIEKHRCR